MIEGINQYAGAALSAIKDSACYGYNQSSEFCGKMVTVIPKALRQLSEWDGVCLISGAVLPYSATLPVIIPTLATKYINASSEYEIDRELHKNREIAKQYKDCKDDHGEETDAKLSALIDESEKRIKVMGESYQNYKKLADRSAMSAGNFAKYMAITLSGICFGGFSMIGALAAGIAISNRYCKNAEEKQLYVNLAKKSDEEMKKMQALKTQINIDKTVINKCRENNDKVEAYKTELFKRSDEVEARQNEMAGKLFGSEAEVDELNRRMGDLDNQVKGLKKELEASNEQIEKLNKQLDQSQKKNEESQKVIESLKQQLADLKKTKEPMEPEIEAEGTHDLLFNEMDELFKAVGDEARL